MKKIHHLLVRAALALVSTVALHGQGALTPPGAPAPTMKTLAEIHDAVTAKKEDARTPISATTTPGDASYRFIITQPGSYYLTGNLDTGASIIGGILIDLAAPAPNQGVTIDLNGFALIGPGSEVGGALGGITTFGSTTVVTVRGGRIAGWPHYGLYLGGPAHVSDLLVEDCANSGIHVLGGALPVNGAASAQASLVTRCVVRDVREFGIYALNGVVRESVVTRIRPRSGSTLATGISAAEVHDSRAGDIIGDVGTSFVVAIAADGLIKGCSVEDALSTGTSIGLAADTVIGSRYEQTVPALGSVADQGGIRARLALDCQVNRLQADTTGNTYGIRAVSARGCIVERIANAGTGSAYGIYAESAAFAGTGISTTPTLQAEGNTISGVNGGGIYAGNGHGHITGNSVRGCTGDAIAGLLSGMVADNSISLPTGANADGIEVEGVVVRDNSVRNFGTGVGIRFTFGGVAMSNTVIGGTAFSFAASTRAAPVVSGSGTTAFDPLANIDL